jgi:hypothetical protein
MANRTTVAKAFVTAACTLAIALLTIGLGVMATETRPIQPDGTHAIVTDITVAAEPNHPNPTHMRPQASQKINSTKYRMVQGDAKSPDGV